MPIIFNFFFLIFCLIYLPLFLLRGKAHKGFRERLGIFPQQLKQGLENKKNIWLHAVSVGEVKAASELVSYLRKQHPLYRIIISTVTPTGNRLARTIVKADDLVIYFPLDLSFIVNKFVKEINPAVFITTETEIWPNLFLSLEKKNIPIILVNGRISERSFKRYRLIKPLIKRVINAVKLFCMRTQLDAQRIEELGAEAKNITVTGNMKFDAVNAGAGYQLSDLGLKQNDLLFICGSTHNGEEEVIVSAFKRLLQEFSNLRLLIAPRHIERASCVEALLNKSNLKHIRFSQILNQPADARVIVLDTIGNLTPLYELADVVFMGGSLIKKGGQNIIEPAFFGKPIIFGPYMFNFEDIARMFQDRGIAFQIRNGQELESIVRKLLSETDLREEIRQKAAKIIEENKGATAKTVSLISQFLS